jgi:hypothetical protein
MDCIIANNKSFSNLTRFFYIECRWVVGVPNEEGGLNGFGSEEFFRYAFESSLFHLRRPV